MRVESAIINQADAPRSVALQVALLDPAGKVVQTASGSPQRLEAGKSGTFRQEINIKNPKLWNLDQPHLYRAVVRVRAGNATLDEETITFGIRDVKFVAATGFWLNGKNLKIKGVCLHHDAGALGAAVPLRAWERRLETLHELGVNAIRTAHNPPSPEFLDLCDRLGFLVMDELFDCWTIGKNAYDYHLYFNDWATLDVRDTVRRDRNHPSVILYSAGNEIRDTPKEDLAKRVLGGLVKAFHEADPTRPVTQALFRPNVSHDYDNGLADLLDVIGTNYRDAELLVAHRAKPTRKIIGTEQGHDLKTWLAARDNPQHAGQFLWSGIDYLGEARNWPIVAAGSGLLDRTGAIKPMAYERQSWWSTKPMVRIVRRVEPARAMAADPGGFEPLMRSQTQFDDWTPREIAAHNETVEAYSNCDEVELVLNGQSLGSKTRNADDAPRVWKVAYQSGTLRAIGKNQGKVVATHELRTASKPAKIVLTADRNTLTSAWDDVVYVTASVVDEKGVIVPTAKDLIAFNLSGPGVIAAVDNGDNASHEPFHEKERRSYQGRCVALIKAASGRGELTLTAVAPNLSEVSIRLAVK